MTGAGLPDGWSLPRLDQIARVTSGKRLPKGRSVTAMATPHPYIRVTDMRMGNVDLSNIHYVPEDVAPKIARYTVDAGDLYISCAGTLGIVGLVPKLLDGANLTENANRISGIQIEPHYLLHVLMSEMIQGHIQNIQTVGAQPKLALGRIRSFEIPCPDDPKEQEAIAEALSDADALILELERLIAKKRLIKQGAMQDLLTAKCRLPGFSGEWESKRLAEIGQVKTGLTYSPTNVSPYGTLVLRSSNIQQDRLAFDNNVFVDLDVSDEATVRTGDLLICVRNGSRQLIGKTAIIDDRADGMAFGAFMSAYRSDLNAYLIWCFQSSVIQKQVAEHLGATINQITKKTLKAIEVPIPADADERTAISAVLTDMDSEIQVLETRLEKARAVKEGMMQNLLAGRIRLV